MNSIKQTLILINTWKNVLRATQFILQIRIQSLLEGTSIDEYSTFECYFSRTNICLCGKNNSSVLQKHKQGFCIFLHVGFVHVEKCVRHTHNMQSCRRDVNYNILTASVGFYNALVSITLNYWSVWIINLIWTDILSPILLTSTNNMYIQT